MISTVEGRNNTLLPGAEEGKPGDGETGKDGAGDNPAHLQANIAAANLFLQ